MVTATFTEPAPYGYLYAGLRVDPPTRVPFVRRSARRAEVLRRCAAVAARLAESPEVVAATVYEAVFMPPAAGHPRFDVLVLVETATPAALATVSLGDLGADFVMAARNVRRIGDIDRSRTGVFLFNHFTAPDFDRALRTWEPIAGWFTHEAGVVDSALLEPVQESPYVFVNHVRLPCAPIRFFLRLLKPSFRGAVSRRLRAEGIGFAAVACRAV